MKLVIISGRSGSGKTIALHALEDLGFYCIDNLPLGLLPTLEHHIGWAQPLVAVGIDARNLSSELPNFKQVVEKLKSSGIQLEIIYLDAEENTLLKRFSETRRKHPLTNEKTTLRDAIRKEQEVLAPIASLSDLIIDTSTLSRQALHNLLRDRVSQHSSQRLQLLLQSFGYKHGLPPDADFVFDLRCLPNPYWELGLKEHSGLEENVRHFLDSKPLVHEMLEDIYQFVKKWVSKFEADNRSYMTIALGCTGGMHRSVYFVESLAQKLNSVSPNIQIRHRELVH